VGVLTSQDRRRLFEAAVERARAEGASVRDVLRRCEDELQDVLASGSMQSSSVGGISQTYALGGGPAVLSAAELLRTYGLLIDAWDAARRRYPDASEEQLVTLVLETVRLSVRSVGSDITMLRL